MTIEERNAMLGEEPEEEEEENEDDDDEDEDEEELVDPQDTLKEKCSNSEACASYKEELNACTERVSSRSRTEEHCTQEFFEFLHCSDHCVAKTLFSQLK